MILIPQPCPEPWDKMHPQGNGRFCDKCCKVVVDFSNWSTEKIAEYFSEKREGRTCGRFKSTQVSKPRFSFPVLGKSSRLVRFLAGLLLVFGPALFTSCGSDENEHLAGDVCYVPNDSIREAQRQDSIAKAHFTDSAEYARSHQPSVFSPEDSAHIADSLNRTKNHVRDFE